MKKWTKEFLKKEVVVKDKIKNLDIFDAKEYNAEVAYKKLGIPKKLWFELSEKSWDDLLISINKKAITNESAITTAFMAGVVVGWKENTKKI